MGQTAEKRKSAFDEYFDWEGEGDWSPATESAVNQYFSQKRGGKMGEMKPVKELLGEGVPSELDKFSALDLGKRAEIIKRVQSNFNESLPALTDQEPDLDEETLGHVARCPPAGLASLASLGIVLKPREFQRMSLCHCGHRDLADQLEEEGCCFAPRLGRPGVHAGGGQLGASIIPSLIEKLIPLMEERSGLWPPLGRRIIRIIVMRRPSLPTPTSPDHAMFDRLADEYSGYRKNFLSAVPSLVRQVVDRQPQVIEPLLSGDRELPLFNQSLVKDRLAMLESLFGMFPSIYFNRAHLPGPTSSHLEAHPNTRGLERMATLAAL